MFVRNVHERVVDADPSVVGRLLDTLGTPDDRLWPVRRWPAISFEQRLTAGVRGGHGPIRYVVDGYEPGRSIRFRFLAPHGFKGYHAFEVGAAGVGARVRHVLEMHVTGAASVAWLFVFRPLHDALLEDALDQVAASVGAAVAPRQWSPYVRLLRRAFQLLTRGRLGLSYAAHRRAGAGSAADRR